MLSGVGAAGSAIAKLLMAHGARDIVGYGRDGALNGDNTGGHEPSTVVGWLSTPTPATLPAT